MRRQLEPALAELDQAVALAPDQVLYLLMRAQLLAQADSMEAARKDLHRALELAPDDPNVILPNALEMLDRDAVQEAGDLLGAAVKRDPGQEELLWWRGLTLLKLEQPESAREVFSRLLTHSELTGSPLQVQGRIGLALSEPPDQVERATAAWTLAASADPLLAVDTAGQLLVLGFEQPIRALAKRAAEGEPDHLDLGYVQAEILRQTGFSDQAVAEVERLLLLEPGPRRAIELHLTAASADGDRMRFGAARERLRTALDLDPGALNALSLLAQAVVTGRGNADDFEDLMTRIEAARERLEASVRAQAMLDQLEQQVRLAVRQ